MTKRNIIVIGASAGGFQAIKQLVSDLPADLDASIFIVWHMSADLRGILPQVLNKQGGIYAAHPVDNEIIASNRIYVAPPDWHMLIDKDRIRITHGPKENRFRPAIDPLFRSAAAAFGARVIGIVLSGALDDGTAGLWTIKFHEGTAIVQDPEDAEFPSMPESALREVEVDFKLPINQIAGTIVNLCAEASIHTILPMGTDNNTNTELRIAKEENALHDGMIQLGELTRYACPECHGVLSAIKEGKRVRFRCHTGHAFSADTLLAALGENIENTLWSAIRAIEESIILLNSMGDHVASLNNPKLAALYFKKASESGNRVDLVRQAVFTHEQMSADSLKLNAEETNE